MASESAVGTKRQVFYDIECMMEDFDSDVGYKPLSDSEEFEESVRVVQPRQEDVDSSEEWKPLVRSKLKRNSTSASRQRRRLTKITPSTKAKVVNPKSKQEDKNHLRRPRKLKSELKSLHRSKLYTAIIPKPLYFGTFTSNTPANNLKFSSDPAFTIHQGPDVGPVAVSGLRLTPVVIQSPSSVFNLSTEATLVEKEGDGIESKAVSGENENVAEEIQDASEASPCTNHQKPSSSIPQCTTEPVKLKALASTSGETLDSTDQDLPSQLSPTTLDDQLSSIFFTDTANSDSDKEEEEEEELWDNP